MANSVFHRYEKKFIIDRAKKDRLLALLSPQTVPDAFCTDNAQYRVCNVYYDTPSDDVIRQSLAHPYYKEKLRMRSYGLPENKDSEVFLELKKKVNGEITKRRAVLPYGQALQFLQDGHIPAQDDVLNTQILREIAYYQSHCPVQPTVFLEYERLALSGKNDPSLRITFDENIRTARSGSGFSAAAQAVPMFAPEFCLMEIKFHGNYPKWLADLLCREELYAHSFSKYGVEYKTHLKQSSPHPEALDVLGRL